MIKQRPSNKRDKLAAEKLLKSTPQTLKVSNSILPAGTDLTETGDHQTTTLIERGDLQLGDQSQHTRSRPPSRVSGVEESKHQGMSPSATNALIKALTEIHRH